jgi:hypothetical protein
VFDSENAVLPFRHHLPLVVSAAAKLIKHSLPVCQLFINTKRAKDTIESRFKVPLKKFSEALLRIQVEFADWTVNAKVLKTKKVALSWIDRYDVTKISINQKLLLRYAKTNDENEKMVIEFITALCEYHELGQAALQITEDLT